MIKFEYKKPRKNSGDFRTPVIFYEYVPNDGPEPGEKKRKVLYECMADIDRVWMKDLEQAKANGTIEDLTVTIRDPLSTYRPTNKHYIEIDDIDYRGKHYNVKSVQPDLTRRDFITIIAGLEK
ncbi:head-tail adaptor protein [Bacillus niameyensis]|uniref:phage head completion protein n=1 Tax=Bacillus niameyensis TaxID=1522308 RepID=UPI000783C39E|nr:head-tail adaptor protein [Bacillus niameyensis]